MLIRDPLELFLSLRNVDKLVNDPDPWNIEKFIKLYTGRINLIDLGRLPEEQLLFLKYEALTASPEETVQAMADFIGIPNHETLKTPTKNGIPWEGNSSRNLRAATIFKNKTIAREVLSQEEINEIESALASLMKRFGYLTE